MVKIETVQHKSNADGCLLHGDLYLPDSAQAFVFLIHGMAEYRKRYRAYAESLAGQNYQVLTMDLRGHGDSPCDGLMGYWGDSKGLERQLLDFIDCIKKFNRQALPVFIFGHSMGSLWARLILQNYPELASAYLLSGSPGKNIKEDAVLSAVSGLASGLSLLGPKTPAKFIAENMNKAFLKKLEKPLTKYDWLSFDRDNIISYIEDPLCGFPFTRSGYKTLAELYEAVYSNQDWPVKRADLPILFISGGQDPVAKIEADALSAAVQDLISKGYQNVRLRIYPESRHEVFFDQQKAQVWQDSFDFFNAQKSKA
ncbi:MAG: alpha/beta fold hydrolase [Eubacteriales bacterium]|nr:alpha/beta fold hydrolase [Eubacteriales bacterium]